MARPTIHLSIARALVRIAETRGVPMAELLAMAALDGAALRDPDARQPIDDLAELWNRLARRLDDPLLPFALARILQIEDYGLMGLVCLTAPTAADALRRLIRYHRLVTDGGELALDGDRLVWRRDSGSGDGYRLLDESVLACTAVHVRQVSGRPFRPTRVTFRHARPPTAPDAAAFFGCLVEYDAPAHAIAFPPEAFAWVPKHANAALADLVVQQADARLAATAEPSIAERTRRRILVRLADDPAIGAIARDLGLAERTLRRRLDEERTTFRDLVDTVRRDRARELFAGGHSLLDIAFALGFSDATALARATRRWFDTTPSELRKPPHT